MKSILILGSEGFIGNHLVHFFLRKEFVVFGCDLFETSRDGYHYVKVSRLSPEWDDLFSNRPFDFCINAAGSGNVAYSMTHPQFDFESNTLDVFRALDALRKYQPNCRYIHISSAAVYGNPQTLPIPESAPMKPLSPYGWHKYMSEMICREFYQLFGIKNAIIRPFSVYGNGLKKQLLWDICTKLSKSKDVELFGTGGESRDFIHVQDLVNAVDSIMAQGNFECEVYNVASGVETTIAELSKVFESCLADGSTIKFSGVTRAGDPLNWCADVTKLNAIGFTPKVALGDGVKKYINWVRELNYEI
jgi:UDP-glucose 4-epimerase